jgi:ubiquinol-cytochrome c reductase subunit 7
MSVFGPLGLSLAGYVRSSRTLTRWLKPVAIWYSGLAGYRKVGLKYDDLCTQSFFHPDVSL